MTKRRRPVPFRETSRPAAGPAGPVRRRAGQRAGVTRDDVLAAAGRLVEREGLSRLTMRRLAAELGVAPNALYTYFPDKTALLDALADAVLAEVRVPNARRERSWRADLTALLHASRRALLRHPELLPLIVSRPGGPNALRLGEAALRLLATGGVHGRRAAEALRALLAYTMGFVAVEVPRTNDPAREERIARGRERIASLPAQEFAVTRAVAAWLARHPSERDFDTGLAWLLAGIARGTSRRARTGRAERGARPNGRARSTRTPAPTDRPPR